MLTQVAQGLPSCVNKQSEGSYSLAKNLGKRSSLIKETQIVFYF